MNAQEWSNCTDPYAMMGGNYLLSNRKMQLWACACCRVIWHLLDDPRSRNAVLELEALADGATVSFSALARAGDVSHDFYQSFQKHGPMPDAEHRSRWCAADAVTVLSDCLNYRLEGEALPDFFRALAHAEMFAAGEEVPRLRRFRRPFDSWQPQVVPERAPPWAPAVLREVLGNPYSPLQAVRSVTRDPASMSTAALEAGALVEVLFQAAWLFWREGLIPRLAEEAYEHRQEDGRLDPQRLFVLADALEESGLDRPEVLEHLRHPLAVHYRGCHVLDWILEKE
jgi:hypothetical protein